MYKITIEDDNQNEMMFKYMLKKRDMTEFLKKYKPIVRKNGWRIKVDSRRFYK